MWRFLRLPPARRLPTRNSTSSPSLSEKLTRCASTGATRGGGYRFGGEFSFQDIIFVRAGTTIGYNPEPFGDDGIEGTSDDTDYYVNLANVQEHSVEYKTPKVNYKTFSTR